MRLGRSYTHFQPIINKAKVAAATVVQFDQAVQAGTLTFSMTCTGTNRYLIVEIAIGVGTDTISGVTYNGVAMTQLRRTAGSFSSELWGLVNPASGSNSVVITRGTGTGGIAYGATSFVNVDQTVPVQTGSGGGSSGTGVTSLSGPSHTTNPGGMVVECVASNSVTATGTTVQGWNDGGGDGGFYQLGTGSAQNTTYTISSGNNALASVVLNTVGQIGSGVPYTDSNTATFTFTAGTTEEHDTFDSATATFTFTPYPNTSPTSLLHDTFTRTTTSDWGTADDGFVWSHGSGTATQEFVSTDHAVFKQLNGGSLTAIQTALIPNADSRLRAVIAPSVLTSSGGSNLLGFRMRSDIGTLGNNYEFRALLTTGGFIQMALVRFDAGVATTLWAAGAIEAPGFTLADRFNVEIICQGTQFSYWFWRTGDPRNYTPDIFWDTNAFPDSVQYLSGACYQVRYANANVGSQDQEWDIYDLDIYNLSETEASVDANTTTFAFTATGAEVQPYSDANTAAFAFTAGGAEGRGTSDAATAQFTFTPAATVETLQAVDSATPNFVFTTSALENRGVTYPDSATAAMVFTTSATESMQDVDSTTVAWVFTPSAVENAQDVEVSTVPFVFTTSATELHTISDAATCQFTFATSDAQLFAGVDAATAQYVLTTSAVEFSGGTGVDAFTAGFVFTASALEVQQNADVATAAWVFTTSATEVHEIPDSATVAWIMTAGLFSPENIAASDAATVAWVMTAGGSEFRTTGNADADTAFWAFTPAPTGGSNVLTDTFARTTASDLGTASDGKVWVKSSGTSANNLVITDHAELRKPAGVNVDSLYFISSPHRDVRANLIIAPTVLVGQVAGVSFTCSFRYRSIMGAPDNTYETRISLTATGGLRLSQFILVAGTPTSLAATGDVFGPGTWTLSDQFNWEVSAVGNVHEHRMWKVGSARPTAPTLSWNTGSDATIYSSGTGFGLRAQANGNPTADETWLVDSISVQDLSEIEASVDADQPTFTFTSSTAAESYGTQDSATAPYVLTASAAEGRGTQDSDTAQWVMTHSGTEVYQPATGDVATIPWVMTPTTVTEARSSADAALCSFVFTGSATSEVHTISDAATSTFTFTPSGTDLWVAGESGTATFTFTPSTTELAAGVDTGQAQYVLTAGAVAEVFGKIDTGTALWTFAATAAEGKETDDAQTPQFFFTAGTPSEFLVQDADVAFWNFLPAAVEGVGTTEGAFCNFVFSAFATEMFQGVDASQVNVAFFVFTAGTIEKQQILDYYLEAVQHSRWSASQTHHFDVVQSHHYVVSQTHRWTVTYRGRRFLNG